MSVVDPEEFADWIEGEGDEAGTLVVQGAIGIALYCQMDELVYHIFCHVFEENKQSVGYVIKARYVEKILGLCASKKFEMAQEISPPS